MLMRAATVVEVLQELFYVLMFYFTCDRSLTFIDVCCKLFVACCNLQLESFIFFTQPPMRRMRICFTDVFFVFLPFPFATKIPDNRSRERLNGFS